VRDVKKLVLILLIAAIFLLSVLPAAAMAFTKPAVCELAGYGPQWWAACMIAIAMELWIDPLDLLH
jgi:hypothetical protein